MLLGGLWHGADWTFVFWGGLHGIYLCINHQWRSFRKSLGHDLRQSNWWGRGLGCIITFIAVVAAWVFFRSENMKVALAIIQPMFGTNGFSFSTYVVPSVRQEILKYFILIWFLLNTQQWLLKYTPSLNQPLSELSSREFFQSIEDFYQANRVPVLGQPKDFMYEPSLFSDTVYHLNERGVRQRTMQIINLLKPYLEKMLNKAKE